IVVHASMSDRLVGLDDLPLVSTVVVVGGALVAGLPGRVLSVDDFLDGAKPARDVEGPIYRDVAMVLFTSGTTGPSKPVLVPWSVVYQFWSWVPADTLAAGESVYGPLPIAHNSGRSCLNYALAVGGTYTYRDRFSGSEFWADVRRFDCRTAALVGPMTAFL